MTHPSPSSLIAVSARTRRTIPTVVLVFSLQSIPSRHDSSRSFDKVIDSFKSLQPVASLTPAKWHWKLLMLSNVVLSHFDVAVVKLALKRELPPLDIWFVVDEIVVVTIEDSRKKLVWFNEKLSDLVCDVILWLGVLLSIFCRWLSELFCRGRDTTTRYRVRPARNDSNLTAYEWRKRGIRKWIKFRQFEVSFLKFWQNARFFSVRILNILWETRESKQA